MDYAVGVNYRTAEELNTAMAGVYKHMMLAVLTSTVISALIASSSAMLALLFATELKWVVMFAPLVAGLALGFSLHKLSKPVAFMLLHGFAAIMGVSMSAIFAVYTNTSIFTAFMGAVVLFGAMSFYGYFTKKSLDSWGKWLLIGVVAIVAAGIINIFVGSTAAQMAISTLAIIIFTGLTAYDTQRIRDELSQGAEGNAEVGGALSLYLNFINIFISLVQLFGNKDE